MSVLLSTENQNLNYYTSDLQAKSIVLAANAVFYGYLYLKTGNNYCIIF